MPRLDPLFKGVPQQLRACDQNTTHLAHRHVQQFLCQIFKFRQHVAFDAVAQDVGELSKDTANLALWDANRFDQKVDFESQVGIKAQAKKLQMQKYCQALQIFSLINPHRMIYSRLINSAKSQVYQF